MRSSKAVAVLLALCVIFSGFNTVKLQLELNSSCSFFQGDSDPSDERNLVEALKPSQLTKKLPGDITVFN